uniref:Uncharacterized protein n=1 Tax=Aegilops tauschii subsp. strangulata TaxID=200361 RepID=A0A453FZ58_AEGTS
VVIMVQGEEASCSWRMASAAHDHHERAVLHLNHQAALAYHGGLQLQPHHHASAAPPAASFLYSHAALSAHSPCKNLLLF